MTIDKSITIKGNGHSIKASGADTAVTIDADDVRLFNVNAESEHGIALIVNEGKKNPTIEGGAYKTCTKKGGYVEDYGKQGEGAIRIMGNNGNITVRDASLTGGLHIINRGEGSLDVTNNDIRFDYKGDTALVGILITYQNSVPSEAEAAKNSGIFNGFQQHFCS